MQQSIAQHAAVSIVANCILIKQDSMNRLVKLNIRIIFRSVFADDLQQN